MKNLEAFLLKGVFATYAIKDLQANGALLSPSLSNLDRGDFDLYSSLPERIRSGSTEMAKYYRYLFALENSLRDLILEVLDEAFGPDWFEAKANSDMKNKLSQRKENEEKNKWHVGRNAHPIFYMDFADLGLLITNNWEAFKGFFMDQHWIKSRVSECERSRNVIAHTNTLHSQEGERLAMYLKDIISQIA